MLERSPRTALDQAREATALARAAFAAGDRVTGIAATKLAAELLLIERLLRATSDA